MLDFSVYIRARTEGFVRREWVFDRLDAWLDDPAGRMFILAGDPGTGKSAVAARLVQMSLGEADPGGRAGLGKGSVTYHHFCQEVVDGTLSPLGFVQGLSESLANRYPAFRDVLQRSASRQYVINSTQNVETVAAGGKATGVEVQIEIKGSDARPLFDEIVRVPLKTLHDRLPAERILIVVDSLDEALLFNPENNIAQLLKLASDFPPSVRFVVTARSNSDRVFDVVGPPTLDLVRDAPSGLDEVRFYIARRLEPVPEPPREAVATRVADASRDNFLFAYHVLNDLVAPGAVFGGAGELELPTSLEDVYRRFLARELAASKSRWAEVHRPLLGAIAVARGGGLTRTELIGVTGLAADIAGDVLDVCRQYLAGGDHGAPFRIYHQSFREFLLTDETYGVYPAERHAAVAAYLHKRHGTSWGKCDNAYALRFAPVHWAEASAGSEDEPRAVRAQELIKLTSNRGYQKSFEKHVGELPLLRRHLERAVEVAAHSDRDDMLPWLLRAVRGLAEFGREYLRGESLVDLAHAGELDNAEGRLSLFTDLDSDWHAAAQLILAWLARDRNPTAAATVHARIAGDGGAALREPLRLLGDRLHAALHSAPQFPADVQPPRGLELGHAIVQRMSGQEYDQELLSMAMNPSLVVAMPLGAQVEMIGDGSYGSTFDAPILVQNANAFPVEGTAQVEDYVRAHAGYNYVEYRNRSLWVVLDAVLRHHPDQDWVRARLAQILVAALTGGGVDFREMLPLTAAVLAAQARRGDATSVLDAWRRAALDTADALQHRRHANDTWGTHKRRLTALMEVYALVVGDRTTAEALLKRIGVRDASAGAPGWDTKELPAGFAGFQAPATLRLADGMLAAGMGTPAMIRSVLDRAVTAAHNVQDYHFAARVTARCNALRRWHGLTLATADLEAMVDELARAPGAPRFAADHIVGEGYDRRRRDLDTLPIEPAKNAASLEELVEVFQRSAVEMRRLNPQHGLTDRLAAGTPIQVPDPGFVPLLAVHLAARAFADPALEAQRSALCRKLVPVAAANPTALDTLLSYVLIGAELDDLGILDDIATAAGPVAFTDIAPPTAALRG